MFQKDGLFVLSAFSHSPHNLIPKLIKPNSTILDVGCNTGVMADALQGKNPTLDGIDINDAAIKIAKKKYRHVYKRDLYKPHMDIPKTTYDYIVFGDILEHLPRPDLTLTDARKYLKKNGVIIASIPNIARLELRLLHLMGTFDYTISGIMSTDHLRFFTKTSAIKMFQECGYTVEKVLPTGLGHLIKVFPTLTAFQFIYVCKLKGRR